MPLVKVGSGCNKCLPGGARRRRRAVRAKPVDLRHFRDGAAVQNPHQFEQERTRIPRRRQVGGERRKQQGNGGPVNPSRQHGRAMERERETPEEDVRKAPEEGEKKKRREESLPCLALPLEGVRLGAELDGRHGGRAGSRSSWSTGAGRVAAERSGAEQSRARRGPRTGAQAPDHR
jgi:hypothetical protein